MMPSPMTAQGLAGQWISTPAMQNIFSERRTVQAYLDVEAALARVQARLGLIPETAAREISARCHVDMIDLPALRARTGVVGFPIVGLVEQLSAACAGGLGEFAHWGATTQDIMDTADLLQFREALDTLTVDLDSVRQVLAAMAARHRDTVMTGRSHMQHALPQTFGYKAAVWLSALDRHRIRLDQLKPRLLVGQFSGAVGSLASLGDKGLAVQDALMAELGLGCPDITWHTARDSLAEMSGWLALVTGSLGKIGMDIVLMSATEIGEVREPYMKGRGSSSTMPQKRNPVVSEMLIVIARNVRQLHGLVLEGLINDQERGSVVPCQTEWFGMPEAFMMTGASLQHATALLEGLEVNETQMRVNLALSNGLIMAEAVMMGLAPLLGRQQAHDIVYDCCRTVDAGTLFLDALCEHPAIAAVMDRAGIARLLEPTNYLGSAPAMVDRLLARRAE